MICISFQLLSTYPSHRKLFTNAGLCCGIAITPSSTIFCPPVLFYPICWTFCDPFSSETNSIRKFKLFPYLILTYSLLNSLHVLWQLFTSHQQHPFAKDMNHLLTDRETCPCRSSWKRISSDAAAKETAFFLPFPNILSIVSDLRTHLKIAPIKQRDKNSVRASNLPINCGSFPILLLLGLYPFLEKTVT